MSMLNAFVFRSRSFVIIQQTDSHFYFSLQAKRHARDAAIPVRLCKPPLYLHVFFLNFAFRALS